MNTTTRPETKINAPMVLANFVTMAAFAGLVLTPFLIWVNS